MGRTCHVASDGAGERGVDEDLMQAPFLSSGLSEGGIGKRKPSSPSFLPMVARRTGFAAPHHDAAASRRTPTTEPTTVERSLDEWAELEAIRVMAKKKDKEAAARVGARRAPGMMAAARALRYLADVGDDTALAKSIPLSVRYEIAAEQAEKADEAAVIRIRKWLATAPYELTRCSSALAAIAAAAPVALLQTQQLGCPADPALEKKTLASLQQSAVRRCRRDALLREQLRSSARDSALPSSFAAAGTKRDRRNRP